MPRFLLKTLLIGALAFSPALSASAESVNVRTVGTSKLISLPDDESPEGRAPEESVTIYRGGRAGTGFTNALNLEVTAPEASDSVRIIAPFRAMPGEACRRTARRTLEPLERRAFLEVCFGDLLPLTEDTAATLYRRFEQASRRACPTFSKAPIAEVRACRTDAIERAVYDLGEPAVIARYLERTGRRANTIRVGGGEPL